MVDIVQLKEEERETLEREVRNFTPHQIEEQFSLLSNKDNKIAFQALLKLYFRSNGYNDVYPYFEQLTELMNSDKSYERTRAIFLLSINTKWDTQNKFDAICNDFLSHVEDEKSITSRQCIKCIENILLYKPNLIPIIKQKLQTIDYSYYTENMKDLIFQDVTMLLDKLDTY